MSEDPASPAAPQAAPAPPLSGAGTAPAMPPRAPRPGAVQGALAGWVAFALAAVATVLGMFALQRAADLERRLELAQLQEQAREQRNAERDRRLADIERQWSQAQADVDVAAGQMTDADLRRRRETLALIDVERVVEQAQWQLRLGASPGIVAEVLAGVDARLGRLAGPAAARVQAALRHDMARLKAAPEQDRGVLAARLDPLLGAVDTWHASADASHPASRAAAPAPGARPPGAAADSLGARVRAWIEREFGDLLRIREIDTPEALRLGPAQQQLLRDRVRLAILTLREAILARDEHAIHAEETATEMLLTRYFDPNQPEVAAAVAQLRATAAAAAPGATPTLDETLAALRAARAAGSGS